MSSRERFVIAQVSDIHCGDPRYDPELTEACLDLLRRAEPDLVLVPGDLTGSAWSEEFEQAFEVLNRLPCPWFVVPGNHDERNVGWRTYMRLFGDRWHSHVMPFGVASQDRSCESLRLVCCDSAEPDLDEGELGRVRHAWIKKQFEDASDEFRIVMLHHHLVAVPNTGRERNTVADAGDVLSVLGELDVDLVVSGHKHVPHIWRVDDMAVVTSGTATTWRIRGEVPPSFNLIEISPDGIMLSIVWTTGAEPVRIPLPRRA